MTVWLGRQEAVSRFQAYLVYAAKQGNTSSRDSHQLQMDSYEELEDDDDLNDPTVPVSNSTVATTHSVSVKPAFAHISLSTITTDFKATGFLPALKSYIRRAYPPPALPLFPTTADRFDVYKRLNVSQPSLAAVGRETFTDRIRATPAVKGCGRLNDVPEHFDMALIQSEDERHNEATKGTYLEGFFHLKLEFLFCFLTHSFFFFSSCFDRAPCWTGAAYFRPSRLLAR